MERQCSVPVAETGWNNQGRVVQRPDAESNRGGARRRDGDIIHLNDEEFELEHGNGIVVFLDKDSSGNPCGGMWYVEDADEDSRIETSLYDLHWEGSLEIIGNRYDTPKLLKIRR